MAEISRSHAFTKEINHADARSQYFNENFYCRNCLLVFFAMTGKPALRRISSLHRNHSQQVIKYSLARRTISCHCFLMNIGLAGFSNKDS